MPTTNYVCSGSVSVTDAVETFQALQSVVSSVDVASCEPGELQRLTAGVRTGQRALDRMILRIGITSERQEANGKGRGAHATMLGDGSDVRGATVRREADRARTATALPKVGQAVDEGRIGAAQIDAIGHAAKDLTAEEQARFDTDDLIDIAEALPADTFARRVRERAEQIKGDHGLAETNAKRARSTWKHWTDQKTGMGRLSAEFDPERFEAIVGAVDGHLRRLANDGGVTKSNNLAAEAAFQLLTGEARSSSGLPHINVVVDLETLRNGPGDVSVRETAAGHSLPPESISRLVCDAVLQRVTLDRRKIPVDVGRKHRTATDAQWHALRAVYRTCAWDGCERPLSWCQAHHIHEWEHQGQTDLCNLIPLCNRHHHAVHEGGWRVKLDAQTRDLEIYDPDQIRVATSRPDRVARPPHTRHERGDPEAGSG